MHVHMLELELELGLELGLEHVGGRGVSLRRRRYRLALGL